MSSNKAPAALQIRRGIPPAKGLELAIKIEWRLITLIDSPLAMEIPTYACQKVVSHPKKAGNAKKASDS